MQFTNSLHNSSLRVFRALIAVAVLLSFAKVSPARADALPDLIVETACISQSDVCIPSPSPAGGQPFDITFTMKNIGTLDAPSTVYPDVFIDHNPNDFIDQTLGGGGNVLLQLGSDYHRADLNSQIPFTPPGNTFSATITITAGLTPGVHQIWVYADASGGNVESDELNNSFLITVTVSSTTVTILSTGSQDGFVLESTETSGKGGSMNSAARTLNIGDDAANRQYRSILSFDTSTIPSTAVIYSVTLNLKYASKAGTLPFSTHGSLVADVRNGAYGNNAALQITDFKNPYSKIAALLFTNVKPGGWYSKSLASGNFVYINRSGVTQFRLRFQKDDDNDHVSDLLKIYSGNMTAASRPQLVVQYYIPGP